MTFYIAKVALDLCFQVTNSTLSLLTLFLKNIIFLLLIISWKHTGEDKAVNKLSTKVKKNEFNKVYEVDDIIYITSKS